MQSPANVTLALLLTTANAVAPTGCAGSIALKTVFGSLHFAAARASCAQPAAPV